MKDPYLYSDVPVLINKLGIKDKEILENRERIIATARLVKVDDLLKENMTVDYNYYKSIHKFLFSDLFEWAGNERTIDIIKSEVVLSGESVDYSKYVNIQQHAKDIIDQMDKVNWSKLNIEEQTDKFSSFITNLWQVHPFREGNTRTTMTFAAHYALAHGFSIDRDIIAENSSYTRDSMAVATVGKEYQDHINKIMLDAISNGDKTYFEKQLFSSGFEPKEKLVQNMRKVNKEFGRNVSVKEIRELCINKNKLPDSQKNLIIQVENDFINQEKVQIKAMKQKNYDLDR